MKAFERVKQYCQAQNISFELEEGHPMIFLRVQGQHDHYRGGIEVDERLNSLTYNNMISLLVPPEKQERISMLLDRINRQINWGCFYQDWDSGTIFFRTYAVCGNTEIPDDIIQHLIYINWYMLDKYFTAIAQVILTQCTPLKALEQVDIASTTTDHKPQKTSWGGRLGGLVEGSGN